MPIERAVKLGSGHKMRHEKTVLVYGKYALRSTKVPSDWKHDLPTVNICVLYQVCRPCTAGMTSPFKKVVKARYDF